MITNSKQIDNKRILVNLYKDILLMTRQRIFYTTLFSVYQQHIKIVIQIHAFQIGPEESIILQGYIFEMHPFVTDSVGKLGSGEPELFRGSRSR